MTAATPLNLTARNVDLLVDKYDWTARTLTGAHTDPAGRKQTYETRIAYPTENAQLMKLLADHPDVQWRGKDIVVPIKRGLEVWTQGHYGGKAARLSTKDMINAAQLYAGTHDNPGAIKIMVTPGDKDKAWLSYFKENADKIIAFKILDE